MRRELQYVKAVKEYGEIKKAAEALYISPPALSKYISGIEKKIGLPLLEKKGTGWSYTVAGELYVSYLEQINDLETELDEKMAELARRDMLQIRINLSGGALRSVLTRALPKIKEAVPNVRVDLSERKAGASLQMLVDGDLDFAYISESTIEKDNRFKIVGESSVPFVLLLNRDHPAAQKAVRKEGFDYPWVDVKELDGTSLYVPLMPPRSLTRRLEQLFPNSMHEGTMVRTDDHTTIYTGIANGCGMALWRNYEELDAGPYPNVVMLSFGEEQLYSRDYIVCRKDYVPTKIDETIIDLICACV